MKSLSPFRVNRSPFVEIFRRKKRPSIEFRHSGQRGVITVMASIEDVRTVDARNVTVVERSKANSVKMAQTFYRRTGDLLKHPSIALRFEQDQEIGRLFFPALLALVLEPVQALVDTSIIGHLGVSELGAVGLGTVTFQFVLGFFAVFIFATTPIVAMHSSAKQVGKASVATCKGSWVALAVGLLVQMGVMFGSPYFMSLLSSDGDVATLASQYLQGRSWGFPAALVMMVSIGAARGHKDMVSPFLGSAAYGVSLAVLDLLFVFGLDWGVQGAGYAASISQWVGAITIMYALERKGRLSLGDLKELPRLKDAAPYISMAPSLALSSVAALAPLLASSSIATSLGPDQLAAHTVLRQISSFWQQMFMAFNATAHSMIASSLSMTNKRKGMDGAARIMERICHLGIATSIPLSILLYSISPSLPAVFTENKLVNADVLVVLPVLLALMPLDALGLSVEGGILGAADTKWIALRTVAASTISLLALNMLPEDGLNLTSIWLCIKLLNISTLAFDLTRFLGPTVAKTIKETFD